MYVRSKCSRSTMAAAAAVIMTAKGNQIDEKHKAQWQELMNGTIDTQVTHPCNHMPRSLLMIYVVASQADAFLKAFVNEFPGNKFEGIPSLISSVRSHCDLIV